MFCVDDWPSKSDGGSASAVQLGNVYREPGGPPHQVPD